VRTALRFTSIRRFTKVLERSQQYQNGVFIYLPLIAVFLTEGLCFAREVVEASEFGSLGRGNPLFQALGSGAKLSGNFLVGHFLLMERLCLRDSFAIGVNPAYRSAVMGD
jgi:hypothetical protein